MVPSASVDDFEEPDVLPPSVPLPDGAGRQVESDFASVTRRHPEVHETVTDHVREAVVPVRHELPPSLRSAAVSVEGVDPALPAAKAAS